MTSEANKRLVRRFVEAVNRRDPDELDAIASGEFASAARQWVSPFQGSFPAHPGREAHRNQDTDPTGP